LAFGEAFGDLERDEDVHRYIEMLDEAGPMIILLTVLPFVRKLLQLPLMKRILPNSQDRVGFGKVMGQVLTLPCYLAAAKHTRIAKELAGERFGSNRKVKRDMLGSFVAHGLTQDEAESEILVQMCVTLHDSGLSCSLR